ncbi:hypothetical protein EBR21_15120, partial [bacterium]|nr:hypothetical protein [bacterium]
NFAFAKKIDSTCESLPSLRVGRHPFARGMADNKIPPKTGTRGFIEHSPPEIEAAKPERPVDFGVPLVNI